MSRAPQLNRRLVLESPQRVTDGAGGYRVDWIALGNIWAEVTGRSGRDTASAGQPVSKTQYKITLRAAPVGQPDRPAPQKRFRDGGRLYAIKSVFEADAMGRFLVCLVEEEVST